MGDGVDFSHRILCDDAFMRFLKDRPDCKITLKHLMYIKASSKHHKKGHTVMLAEDYKTLVDDKLFHDSHRNITTLGAFVKDKSCPEFLQKETDIIAKRVRFAVFLANEPPFRTAILTTSAMEPQYKTNKHYKEIKSSVTIKSELEAITFLRELFRKYVEFKNYRRSFMFN